MLNSAIPSLIISCFLVSRIRLGLEKGKRSSTSNLVAEAVKAGIVEICSCLVKWGIDLILFKPVGLTDLQREKWAVRSVSSNQEQNKATHQTSQQNENKEEHHNMHNHVVVATQQYFLMKNSASKKKTKEAITQGV